VPNGLAYLQTLLFILVIAALVQLVEIVLKKYIPGLYKALGVYLPLITTNCAVLGVAILVAQRSGENYGFLHALVNALGAGVGYLVAMMLFSGVRERIEHSSVPEFLKGMPITLVSAAIVALSFLGFQGIAEKL
jgi:electron transport complex protein RnfA